MHDAWGASTKRSNDSTPPDGEVTIGVTKCNMEIKKDSRGAKIVQWLRHQKPPWRQNKSTSRLTMYIAIARDGEATRVYAVAPGDNLDEAYQWDRALTEDPLWTHHTQVVNIVL